MRSRFILVAFTLASVLVITTFGCRDRAAEPTSQASTKSASATESDAHEVELTAADVDRPPDYASAVERIILCRDSIRDEIAAQRPHSAHRPLDEVTFVLEWMPAIARDNGVAKKYWEAVNLSSQSIRLLLDQVHEQIDNGEQPDFDAVAGGIQDAIATLSDIGRVARGRQATEREEARTAIAPDNGSER